MLAKTLSVLRQPPPSNRSAAIAYIAHHAETRDRDASCRYGARLDHDRLARGAPAFRLLSRANLS
jgi:hypothetical protein